MVASIVDVLTTDASYSTLSLVFWLPATIESLLCDVLALNGVPVWFPRCSGGSWSGAWENCHYMISSYVAF